MAPRQTAPYNGKTGVGHAPRATKETEMFPCWSTSRPGRPALRRVPTPWRFGLVLCLGLMLVGLAGPEWTVAAPKPKPAPLSPCAERPAEQILASFVPPDPISFYVFPRPPRDTGRGIHWVPTGSQAPAVVDRLLAEARTMRLSWLTFLNDDAAIGPNDYLVRKAVASQIEPVMRVYTRRAARSGRPDRDGAALSPAGVRYFQLYNEPNLASENVDVGRTSGAVAQWSAAAGASSWAAAIRASARPVRGTVDDLQFLDDAGAPGERGDLHLLDCAWLASTTTLQPPIDYVGDQHTFCFRLYHQIIAAVVHSMIATEGGAQISVACDPAYPPVSPARQVELVVNGYRYMAQPDHEPYYWPRPTG
jgi:hypothetical protein